jgi:hypothetical protein
MGGGAGRKRIFIVSGCAIFMEKDGHYVRVDNGIRLPLLNEVLSDYRLTRRDFDDPNKTEAYLFWLLVFHSPSRGECLGSLCPNGDPIRGKENSEAVLRELHRDPQFVFKGNNWTTTFNTFTMNGAVNRWDVAGRHDPTSNSIEIVRTKISPLRPPGTVVVTHIPGMGEHQDTP